MVEFIALTAALGTIMTVVVILALICVVSYSEWLNSQDGDEK